ncbi:MAG: GxxExxY protein [Chitinophagaceae bacterium]
MADYKFKEITEKIIGSSMKVHAALGNGFQEVIYQRALEIEMQETGLDFARELTMPVHYKGRKIGERRVDFFVQEKIMVEIKAIINLENVHLAQAKIILKPIICRLAYLLILEPSAFNLKDWRILSLFLHKLQLIIKIYPNRGSDNEYY